MSFDLTGVSIIVTILGIVVTIWAMRPKRKWRRKSVNLHVKMVYTKGNINKPYGYYKSGVSSGLTLWVPIFLEACNTDDIPRIVRNVNIHAFNSDEKIASFVQIQRTEYTEEPGNSKRTIVFGDSESYTISIQPHTSCRYNMLFVLKETELPTNNKNFNKLVISYFDERDTLHEYHLIDVDKCWIEGELAFPKDWISLNKKRKIKRGHLSKGVL